MLHPMESTTTEDGVSSLHFHMGSPVGRKGFVCPTGPSPPAPHSLWQLLPYCNDLANRKCMLGKWRIIPGPWFFHIYLLFILGLWGWVYWANSHRGKSNLYLKWCVCTMSNFCTESMLKSTPIHYIPSLCIIFFLYFILWWISLANHYNKCFSKK